MRSGEREKRLSGRQRRGRIISGNFEPAQEEMVGGDRRGMVSLVSFPDRLIHESSSEVGLPHHPRQRRQEGFRGDAGVGAKRRRASMSRSGAWSANARSRWSVTGAKVRARSRTRDDAANAKLSQKNHL